MTPEQEIIFEFIYKKYYRDLHRYACAVLSDWSLAEDAVQITFAIACSKEDFLKNMERPMPWLLGMLKNVLRRALHEKIRQEKIAAKFSEQSSDVYESDVPINNLRYLKPKSISNEDFDIFVLATVAGYTRAEIAKMYGISTAACYKRIERTRQKLKKYLRQ